MSQKLSIYHLKGVSTESGDKSFVFLLEEVNQQYSSITQRQKLGSNL